MRKFRRIGVLTSGGDAPGMNACIRAIARRAMDQNIEVVGIRGGYQGLIDDDLVDLPPRSVSNIITRGGTILYSERCLAFKTPEGMAKALETCRKNRIDAVIAIGGDGTFRGATELANHGIPTIGVPGTIDNDITATDYTIGFDTAMNTTINMINCLRDTCESHRRCNVVEVMGRNCGQIALYTGISSGAVSIAIPELSYDKEAAIDKINSIKAAGKRGMIVVVSEGIPATHEGESFGESFTREIIERTGIDSRFARLGHIVRGGDPSLRDRFTATRMGVRAVEILLDGQSDKVVCEVGGEIHAFDINFALVADHMYKNKLEEGELDAFRKADVVRMKEMCVKRTNEIRYLYNMAKMICK